VLGPMSYPRIIELSPPPRDSRRVTSRGESAELRLARNTTSASAFRQSPTLRWDSGLPATQPAWAADSVLLPSRHFQLVVRRETGALLLNDGARRKRRFIHVEGSRVSSLDRKARELGEAPQWRGARCSDGRSDMALAMLPRFGGGLGDAMSALGVLRPSSCCSAHHPRAERRRA